MKNKKLIFTVVIIIIAVAFFIAGLFYLPDTVVTQISINNNPTTMPRLTALLLPLAISVIFGVLYYMKEDKKYLIISLVGILVNIMMFVVNLMV